ncbi:Ig-like domain-containing protein [Krasilnikovia sp. M28-CT-15]|uniref:RCC1 domain-containing protein n=1 Tax=Krasilnikovia sp. M28-CT-15 TaxID=3373540 RepID=UPI003875CD36
MACESRKQILMVGRRYGGDVRVRIVALLALIAGIIGVPVTAAAAPQAASSTAAVSWRSVEAGFLNTCATRTDGTLWCWGANRRGELGDGTTIARSTPVQVGTATTWDTVSAGHSHTCATRTEGTLWCWGDNSYGQLGDGTTTRRDTPVQIGAGDTWNAVSAGDAHTCATRAEGTLWCWGDNYDGELGDGTNTSRYTPVQVDTVTTWDSVSAGWHHTCATRTDGTLWCWGSNGAGEIGDTSKDRPVLREDRSRISYDRSSPVQVGTVTTWNTVSVGDSYTCATRTDGTLWCWGTGTGGPPDDQETDRYRPVQIGADATWNAASAGWFQSCATRTDGTLWCWGYNRYGQLGDGTAIDASTPRQVGNTTSWDSASIGFTFACGTDTAGLLRCWGNNSDGQLGDGTTVSSAAVVSPRQLGNGTTWASVSAKNGGSAQRCDIRVDGGLWCQGYNGTGQVGDGTTITRSTPVQVGTATTWKAVTAGSDHTCATRTDGTLWCWGYNYYGQLGDGTATARYTPVQIGAGATWKAVTAGYSHTCATRTDGTLWCWGKNVDGQLGVGATANQFLPTRVGGLRTWATVMAGGDLTCADRTDDTLWCWGRNVDGFSRAETETMTLVDVDPPDLEIISPASDQSIGRMLTVTPAVSDLAGIATVGLYVDGAEVATATSAPWTLSWDAGTRDGPLIFTVKAQNTHGADTQLTRAVTIDVEGPRITTASPTDGATVPGTFTATIAATDPAGVAYADLSVNGTHYARDTTAPYTIDVTGQTGAVELQWTLVDEFGYSTRLTRTVTVDAQGPQVTAASPADGATVSGTFTATIDANDAAGIAYADLSVNGATNIRDTSYPYAILVTGQTGTVELRWTVTDTAGNTTSLRRTVTVDTQGPSITAASPADGATVPGTFTATITATDPTGIGYADLSVNGTHYARDTTAPYSVTVTGQTGTVELRWTLADKAGNTTQLTRTVTVDTQGPQITAASPADGATVPGTFTATIDANDAAGIAYADLSVNGATYVRDTSYPYAIPVTAKTGTAELRWTVTDTAGNTRSLRRTVTVDTQGPSITTASPTNGATVPGTFTATIAATDPAGIAYAELSVNGTHYARDTTAPYSVAVTGQTGTVELQWTLADEAGNTTQLTRTVTVDTQGPTVTAVSPADGTTVPGTTTATIAATDPAGIAYADLSVNGTHYARDTTAPYTIEVTGQTGAIELRWTLVDELGNSTQLTRTVTVDTRGPQVTTATPAQGALLPGTITATIAATDPAGIAYADLSVNGTHYARDTTAPYGIAVARRNGPVTLQWTLVDGVGNTTTYTRTVINDNLAPTIKIAKGPANGANVRGYRNITVTAADQYGMARVELLVNGRVIARDTAPGYAFRFDVNRYATRVGQSIKVQVRAVDRAGNIAYAPTRTWKRR